MHSIESILRHNFDVTEKHLRQQIGLLTELLATLCDHIEKSPQAPILITISDGKVAGWWGKHKKVETERIAHEKVLEARRIARENKEREKKDARDKLLQKLTPEEKEILGIK